jgi:hypothetical protein
MRHRFPSAKSDGADSTLVQPSNWNDLHDTKVTALSSNTTLNATHDFVAVTTSTSTITITLPAASGLTGRTYTILKIDSGYGTVVVDGNASETINGNLTYTLKNQYEMLELVCDGSNWLVKNWGENLIYSPQPNVQVLSVSDDFVASNLGAGNNIGQLSWAVSPFAGFVNASSEIAWPHVGIVKGTTGTTIDNVASMDLTVGQNQTWGALGSHTDSYWRVRYVFKLSQTTACLFKIGMGVLSGADWFNGLGLRYSTASGDTNFMVTSTNGNVETAASLGVAADTNWHTVDIFTDGVTAAKVYVSLDGNLPKTICSGGDVNGIPTTADIGPYLFIRTLAAAAKSCVIDYFSGFIVLSNTSSVRN